MSAQGPKELVLLTGAESEGHEKGMPERSTTLANSRRQRYP